MFNGMFSDGDCGGLGTKLGGCNCTWILLIILFLSCYGGKIRNINLNINPGSLILMLALLVSSGGVTVGGSK